MHGNHIDVALYRNDGTPLMGRRPRLVMVIKNRTLVKQRRLRRVQIFRRHIRFQCTTAKGNNLAARIANGKHHPVPETVISHGDIIPGNHQPRLRHLLHGYIFFGEMRAQRRAVIGPIANPELFLNGRRQLPVRKITPRLRPPRRLQFRLKKLRGNFHDVIKTCANLLALHISFRKLGHRQARFRRQPLHRFRKTRAFFLNKECKNIARLLAAKTMVPPLPVIHMKRRRLLTMEGTTGPVIPLARIGLAPVPRHPPPNDGRNRNPPANVIKK